ncbi:triphosphoribosyl-dephospho-CoA synthase CitG [Oscillospiraceae bacterium LTW-04]|nr:triphosphoribosyl-dephospho-CoA synthase CitG [Oscillospiraceae bacterium MB24-C1]
MKVQLEEMLLARERRAAFQQELLLKYSAPLICLTMNIAGENKRFESADRLFDAGVRLIDEQLRRHNVEVAFRIIFDYNTGLEGYWAVNFSDNAIKKMMVQIEDAFDAARLFDIDVLNSEGEKLSRSDFGAPPRRCLICGDQAAACARSRRHGLDAIEQRTKQLIEDYLDNETAEHIAGLAVKSLLYEVCVTPKPGLVDRANAGAHRDMDIFTFMDSATALTPYFKACALKGARSGDLSPAQLFASLRYIGQRAESDMFGATGGVNTHKGAIYSMGILCAATGRLWAKGKPTPEQLCLLCAEMTGAETTNDLKKIEQAGARTAGERIYAQHGISGIRGEVAAGFPSVRDISLPVFKALLAEGYSLNDAGAIALIHLMAKATDTNVISRVGVARQKTLQEALFSLLEKTPHPELAVLQTLDADFIAENISPGGCADLLAFTFMLHFLCE